MKQLRNHIFLDGIQGENVVIEPLEYLALRSEMARNERILNAVADEARSPVKTESSLGKWQNFHSALDASVPYDDQLSYELGAIFLRDCRTIEDWGCGPGWFRTRVNSSQIYAGIDGSSGPSVDVITDLSSYTSNVEGIFIRHVLDHNVQWREILTNAVASFQKKFVLVLFTPIVEKQRHLSYLPDMDVPEIALPGHELLAHFGGCKVRYATYSTDTGRGKETIFYVSR